MCYAVVIRKHQESHRTNTNCGDQIALKYILSCHLLSFQVSCRGQSSVEVRHCPILFQEANGLRSERMKDERSKSSIDSANSGTNSSSLSAIFIWIFSSLAPYHLDLSVRRKDLRAFIRTGTLFIRTGTLFIQLASTSCRNRSRSTEIHYLLTNNGMCIR
jgi:hypothetical protein